MNKAFEKYCEDNAIPKHGSVAAEHWEIFRAGMLAAADICDKKADRARTSPGGARAICDDAIREAAK